MRRALPGLLPSIIALAGIARASDLPPWRDANDLPLPDGTISAIVDRADLPIEAEPKASAGRRGAAALGARLPVFAAKRGPGCAGRWLSVGPLAWICQDAATLSADPWIDPDDRAALAVPGGLPFRYYFVGRDGSNGYLSLKNAEETAPDQELQPGFALAVVEQRQKGADLYARTHHGLWVPMRDLGPVAGFAFHGEEVADGKLDFAWVVEDRAPTFSKAEAGVKGKTTRTRFEKVAVLEDKKTFVRVGEGEWLRKSDVRRPTAAPPPAELRAGERWIDVELASQTLVAYEGDKPVFATLVSTGKGAQGTETATPKGTHRIWVKLESSNMDNLEDDQAERFYAIEDVPYVQYFSKGVGLHGVFWHRAFGHVRSHGCVNLAPLDAQRLFAFTGPHLPAGWTAVLPTAIEEGTIVRVR